jgi:hypothetical protein
MVVRNWAFIELSLRSIFYRDEIKDRDYLPDDLSKIYPICSYCKKVRNKTGEWVRVEKYVEDISGSLPSHGVCPVCLEAAKNKSKQGSKK